MKSYTMKRAKRFLSAACAIYMAFACSLSVCAEATKEERLEHNRGLAIESNMVPGWPAGPVVSAESAILMEAQTGVILYEKNIHQKQFPASTTKILTTLIAAEECELDEIVHFSREAVYSIPYDSSHIAIDAGEELTVEQCLNGILIRSANEVSAAIAEHVSGTMDAFAEKMNERAKELGCIESHFVNPNGLPNDDHYTSAYDLAMIGRGFFANDLLCKISTTPMLHIPPSDHQPDDIVETNMTQLLPGRKYAYEYLVGCKTGYTNVARNCLVTCAEKNGMKLICVVLKDENPEHYEDTIALFNYGFSNFDKINIARNETKYNIENTDLFFDNNEIFGNSKPILSLNKNDCVILPKTADFADAESTISYDDAAEGQIAKISYTYHGVNVGSASLDFSTAKNSVAHFESVGDEDTSSEVTVPDKSDDKKEDKPAKKPGKEPLVIFINIAKVLLWAAGIFVAAILLMLLYAFLVRHHFLPGPKTIKRRRAQRRREAAAKKMRRAGVRQARRRAKRSHRNIR